MKRTFKYILPIICTLWCAGCSEENINEVDGPVTEPQENYTSYWYYSHEVLETFTFEAMGLAESKEFNPYVVAHRGDTLFVANIGTAGNSLILFDKKSNRPMRTLKTWTFNGQEKSFGSNINAIVPAGNRLYVAEVGSRIHAFSLPQMEYISCIGNGNWWDAVFQAQAATVKDGLIFARDKDGKVSIYKESDVTPEKYQGVRRYKQSSKGPGNADNNGFAAHYMQEDGNGRILLTAYEASSIRVLDPSKVTDEMKGGESIDLDETWVLPFKPKSFALTDNYIYVTGSNDSITVFNHDRERVKVLKAIPGFTFTRVDHIYRESDEVLWVSDYNTRTLVKMGVFKAEIREYETVDENIVKVQAARTRSGEVEGELYVNVRTHQIVDPAEVE